MHSAITTAAARQPGMADEVAYRAALSGRILEEPPVFPPDLPMFRPAEMESEPSAEAADIDGCSSAAVAVDGDNDGYSPDSRPPHQRVPTAGRFG